MKVSFVQIWLQMVNAIQRVLNQFAVCEALRPELVYLPGVLARPGIYVVRRGVPLKPCHVRF